MWVGLCSVSGNADQHRTIAEAARTGRWGRNPRERRGAQRREVERHGRSLMQDFTEQGLAEFDGKNGQPAYVAFKGTVYNVTESSMWGGGDHEGEHAAGHDLTKQQDEG